MPRKVDKYNRYLKETAFIGLKPGHRDAFHSLYKSIVDVSGFQLLILQFNDPRYRDHLIGKIASIEESTALLRLDAKTYPTFHDFEKEIERLAKKSTVINVVNLENWLFPKSEKKRITGFNYHREGLAASCTAALLLWMTEPDIKAFALGAPDMWAWRSAVLDFNIEKESVGLEFSEDRPFMDGLLLKEKVERINEIKAFLEEDKETSEKLKASLLDELGRLYLSIGKNDEALRYFEKSLEISREIGDKSGESTTLHNMALIALGNKDIGLTFKYEGAAYQLATQTGDVLLLYGVGKVFGQLLFSSGKKEEGITVLKRAIKIGKESRLPSVEEVEEILQNLLAQE